ncbi:hypothetical protein EVAR_5335_1 [Eumeta japonica]|uniref:Uncharacterized protein n=1 Tax=Eumeta variegata TaxID=151549 RepID=A0A4C1TNZ3_EUMVA|nr:hypothetical protein EVAR_5335_1 [Eumeta japonica]
MTYGSECWTTLKKHKQKLHPTGFKELRRAGGVTRLNKLRNEYVRGCFEIAPTAEKIKEGRLRWYGYVVRRDDSYSINTVLNINSMQRSRDKPPATWSYTVEKSFKLRISHC